MERKYDLVCTLKDYIFSRDGDFIPAGTPVRVMNVIETPRKITVRAAAYAYPDTAGDEPNVWCGIEFEADPDNLVYHDSGPRDRDFMLLHFDGGRDQ